MPLTREALTDRYFDPIIELNKVYPDVPKVCAGDWFDRAHNSERIIQRSLPLLEEIRLIIAGNHDHAGRESAVTSMQLLAGLLEDQANITIAEDHLNAFGLTWSNIGGVGIYSIPHCGTQALFEEACYKAASTARAETGHKVLMIHANVGNVGGGKPDSCLYLTPQIQQGIEDAFDFIITGHEHMPSKNGKLIVLGSTQPCGFGELGTRFFWEFHEDEDGALYVKKVPIASQLSFANYDVATLLADPTMTVSYAELVDLQGTLPISQSRNVQRLVKTFFEMGTKAVRMDVKFEAGAAETGDEVQGSMKNLVDVVRAEIGENKAWLGLLEEALKKNAEYEAALSEIETALGVNNA